MSNGFASFIIPRVPLPLKLGHVLENDELAEEFRLLEHSAVSVGYNTPNSPTVDLFSTVRFPSQLNERDEYLLFHCKLPSASIHHWQQEYTISESVALALLLNFL